MQSSPQPGPRSRCEIDSPIGTLTLVADDAGLTAVHFEDEHKRAIPRELPVDDDHPVLRKTAEQLDEYFSGERQDFDLPLHLTEGTEFEREVWRVLATIPFGKTISYGEQAAAVGRPGGAQAVGAANGQNPIAIILPCHRVIGADGSMVGFGGGVPTKVWLLDHELGNQRLF